MEEKEAKEKEQEKIKLVNEEQEDTHDDIEHCSKQMSMYQQEIEQLKGKQGDHSNVIKEYEEKINNLIKENEKMKEENENYKHKEINEKLISKYGLDKDAHKLLKGTAEEKEETAKTLSNLLGKKQKHNLLKADTESTQPSKDHIKRLLKQ